MLSIITFFSLLNGLSLQNHDYVFRVNKFEDDHEVFCEYVKVFSEQVMRNRIRNVPFLRLDEFDYFNEPFSSYLSGIAFDIYKIETLEVTSVTGLSNDFYNECKDIW